MRELETTRLRLRRIAREDTQTIFDNWASDPEVTKYLTWYAHESVSVTQTVMEFWQEEYKKEPCYRYGIERREDSVLMGMIDVVGFRDGNPVIGYCSGRAYWNQGYMTEALQAVVRELFADGYKTILIEAMKENIGSNRVIQKAGFSLVGSRETVMSPQKPEIVTINSYRLSR